MKNNIRNIKDLEGYWVKYYHKIDGTIYSCGVPQYRTFVKIKKTDNWEVLLDNLDRNNYDPILANEVMNFLYCFGQLEKIPNGYDSYLDLGGTMKISPQLLKQYLSKNPIRTKN